MKKNKDTNVHQRAEEKFQGEAACLKKAVATSTNVNISRSRSGHDIDRVLGVRRYSTASCCSLSSGTDMKIFWQNMVKISEEKQLTRLATLALRHQVTTCQTLAFHLFDQTSRV